MWGSKRPKGVPAAPEAVGNSASLKAVDEPSPFRRPVKFRPAYFRSGWRTVMSNKSNSTVAMMGIDIGKNPFHVVGLDQRGAIVANAAAATRPE
jgi:hypothetical protein